MSSDSATSRYNKEAMKACLLSKEQECGSDMSQCPCHFIGLCLGGKPPRRHHERRDKDRILYKCYCELGKSGSFYNYGGPLGPCSLPTSKFKIAHFTLRNTSKFQIAHCTLRNHTLYTSKFKVAHFEFPNCTLRIPKLHTSNFQRPEECN